MSTLKMLPKMALIAIGVQTFVVSVNAYPEYQEFIKKNSGRSINCAMCHAHPDGPEGMASGQIGKLTAEELKRLGKARAAFEPGQKVESPILNLFGNRIIEEIGKKKFLELRHAPGKLSEIYPYNLDLDQDSIPDMREYEEGTHPLKPMDGNPWALFWTNLKRNRGQIALVAAATISSLVGWRFLLHGFAAATRAERDDEI